MILLPSEGSAKGKKPVVQNTNGTMVSHIAPHYNINEEKKFEKNIELNDTITAEAIIGCMPNYGLATLLLRLIKKI